MSFRRAVSQGAAFIGPELNDDNLAYGLDNDKITERARWLDDYRFQLIRHGYGRATLETYEARWDRQARPFYLSRFGAQHWTHPSGKVVVGAWRIQLVESQFVQGRHQEIAEYIFERGGKT